MYQVDLAWKSFSLNMDAVEAWMRANAGDKYVGNSADTDLSLHFSEQPDGATIQHIQDYWDALTDQSSEATTYVPKATIAAALQAAREDAITKTWDQLSPAQRKILAGLSPTRADLGL